MKVQIAISGQYRENYGAHDWDGIGECPQYWKNKGSHVELAFKDVEMNDIASKVKEAKNLFAEKSWRDDHTSCDFFDIVIMPNGLAEADFVAFEYNAYEDIVSLPKEELARFKNFFGED